jgi:phosphatidate phosphatase APP1
VRRSLFGRVFGTNPHAIALYDGFGARGRVLVQGRVLQDEAIPAASADRSRWDNAWALFRRADADPLRRAVVTLTIGTATHEFHADDEGFFVGWMDAQAPSRLDPQWVRVDAELVSPRDRGPVVADGRVYYPAVQPDLLVISDVDDTVLQSNVTSFLQAVRTMVFENSRTRLPFPGVAAFYQALREGPSGQARNPTFYVSSSPWNLYDVIKEFLEIQGIPWGPLMLRDVDFGLDILSSRHHHAHKREMIRRVLTTYEAPAILIGDSGQQDPEIYREIVRAFPDRIKAIYIRNVSMTEERARAIQALADEVLAAHSSLVLADDTLTAARHAAEHGYIAPEALAAIVEEKAADEGTTAEKKDAPGARDASEPPTATAVIE